METTLNSEMLADRVRQLETAIQASGILAICDGINLSKEAEVELDGGQISDDAFLGILKASNPPFVTLSKHRYERLLHQAIGTDNWLEEADLKFLDRFKKFEGALNSAEITWIADGIVYQWSLNTSWFEEILEKFNEAIENHADVSQSRKQAEHETYLAKAKEMHERIFELPEYRDSNPLHRKRLLPSLLDREGWVDEKYGQWQITQYLVARERETTDDLSLDVRAEMPRLAKELGQTSEWKQARTAKEREALAGELLLEYTKGWRLAKTLAVELADKTFRSNRSH